MCFIEFEQLNMIEILLSTFTKVKLYFLYFETLTTHTITITSLVINVLTNSLEQVNVESVWP